MGEAPEISTYMVWRVFQQDICENKSWAGLTKAQILFFVLSVTRVPDFCNLCESGRHASRLTLPLLVCAVHNHPHTFQAMKQGHSSESVPPQTASISKVAADFQAMTSSALHLFPVFLFFITSFRRIYLPQVEALGPVHRLHQPC